MIQAPTGFRVARGLLLLLGALLVSVPHPGLAQTKGPAPLAEMPLSRIAQGAVNFLAQGCAPNLGNAAGLESYARANNFAPARSEVQPAFQQFGPGSVWVQQRSDVEMAMIWKQDGLQCRLIARRADLETARAYFRSVIEGVNRPGVSITKEMDREVDEGGRHFQQIVYRLQSDLDPQSLARAFVLTTFSAPDAAFAVIATVAATPRR